MQPTTITRLGTWTLKVTAALAVTVAMAAPLAAPAGANPFDLADSLPKKEEPQSDLDLALHGPDTDKIETPQPPRPGKNPGKDAGDQTGNPTDGGATEGGTTQAGTTADSQMVGVADALAGREPNIKCIKVRGIRGWRLAKRALRRLGYRRLHVVRYVPRKMTPIAGRKGAAVCTGGWFLVRARKGRKNWRLAIDARTLKVAARARR